MHDSQGHCVTAWEGGIRGQTRILSLEPVSHEPSRNKRDHVRLGDTHSEDEIAHSLLSSPPSTDSEDKLKNLRQDFSLPSICRVNRSHVEKHIELFTAPKTLPRPLTTGLSENKMQKDFLDCFLCFL